MGDGERSAILGHMAYDDLRSLLRALEREGDLKRIKAEVDPYLEVGEIVDRVQKPADPLSSSRTSADRACPSP